MVEGPGDVYICGACIQLCQGIIEEEKRRRGLPQGQAAPAECPPWLEAVRGVLALPEDVAALHLPAAADQRLQALMNRNNEGTLTPAEREELKNLVEASESMALLRARALQLLGRQPGQKA